jgi:CYTH domain-containing protein
MDWNLIIQIVIAVLGAFLAYQNAMAGRLRTEEAKNRALELKNINEGIKRIHFRIDDVEKSNEKMVDLLNNGKDGVFVRLATIETILNKDDS